MLQNIVQCIRVAKSRALDCLDIWTEYYSAATSFLF